MPGHRESPPIRERHAHHARYAACGAPARRQRGRYRNRLLAVSDQTSEAVVDTQRASITNAAAYRAGGQHVLDVMEPLVAIRVDLIVIVGPIASP